MRRDKAAAGGRRDNTLNLQSSSARAVQEAQFLYRQKMWGGNYLFSLIHSGLVTHRKILYNEGYFFFFSGENIDTLVLEKKNQCIWRAL